MGGIRSGRQRQTKRLIVQNCLGIEILNWRSRGLVQPGAPAASDGKTVQEICWTTCNVMGDRPWFACPRCHKRVAKLFNPVFGRKMNKISPSGGFECRRCLNLSYQSSNASGNIFQQRQIRQSEFRKRLSVPDGQPLVPIPPKPKGMRSETYRAIVLEYFEAERQFYQDSFLELTRLRTHIQTVKRKERSFDQLMGALVGELWIAKLIKCIDADFGVHVQQRSRHLQALSYYPEGNQNTGICEENFPFVVFSGSSLPFSEELAETLS